MLALLAAASLGAQPCAPIQTLAQQALGAAGVVATGPASTDTTGCSVSLNGGAEMGASFVQVAAKLDQALTGEGWTRNLSADADGPDETAAGYDRAGQSLSVSVSQSGRSPKPAYSVVLALAATSDAAPAPDAMTSAVVLDPACLAKTAWAVDPAADKIQAFGCRPLSDIPAPDAEGFVNYARPAVDGQDGGFTRAKPSADAPAGKVVFVVQDNTGGSFTAQATVTGVLGGDGFMEADGLTVE
jgi:hypothetical protein